MHGSRRLTFSLGVPLSSGFSAFPRKFGDISKVEYKGARKLSQGDTAQGLKVTLDQGQYLPAAEDRDGEGRGNLTPTPRSGLPSCLKTMVRTLPTKTCEHLLGIGGITIDHIVLLKQSIPEPFPTVACSKIEQLCLVLRHTRPEEPRQRKSK